MSFEQVRAVSKTLPGSQTKKIRQINLVRYNVFDPSNPKENNAVYRWLNGLHVITTEQTIKEDLLFQEGEAYNALLLTETERILRQRKYIYDAKVSPIHVCDKVVDIEVATRDTWTITPGFSVSHSGGETSTKLSVAESNLFGSGKHVSFSRAKTNQRTEYTLRYRDPNIAGTHRTTAIELSDNSDGERQYIKFALPFFSLDSKKSYGLSYHNEVKLDPIYAQEDKLYEIKHKIKHYNLYYGRSKGYRKDRTRRWRYGISYLSEQLSHAASPESLRQHRDLFYPWVEFSTVENHFIKIQNFHSIKRTEDINLGRTMHLKLGYSPRSLSDDDGRYIIDFASTNAFRQNKDLFTIGGKINGNWNDITNKAEGLLAKFNASYYRFIDEDWVFFAGVKAHHLANPMVEQQLFLGGETGLRGYPVRFNEGTKNIVLSLEQRYYSESYWFQLVRVGAAAYFDLGRSWEPQLPQTELHNGWHANIGIGLRLTPSRVDANHIIHIDVASPLNADSSIDKMQVIVKVKQSF